MPAVKNNAGFFYAFIAAILFGTSTPVFKILLPNFDPWMLAGILYFGSGIGLALIYIIAWLAGFWRNKDDLLALKDIKWLAGATVFGGILGPVFLMIGLSQTDAASASLLLNVETVLTALIALFFFKENFDKRMAIGMLLILAGGAFISWPVQGFVFAIKGPLFILAACLSWALDNNFTRKISASNPVQIVTIKSLIAGSVNILLALFMGSHLVGIKQFVVAGSLGFLGYGVSLLCFVMSLRHMGSARTGVYFSLAPFVGAIIAVAFLGDKVTPMLLIASVLMGIGLWLNLTENHLHEHKHSDLLHSHAHEHDEHHNHTHATQIENDKKRHTHKHTHELLVHNHAHYPDIHHSHEHV